MVNKGRCVTVVGGWVWLMVEGDGQTRETETHVQEIEHNGRCRDV